MKNMKIRKIVCLVAVVLLALCLTACGSSPSDVVRTYMDAFSRGDLNGMIDCMDPDSAALINGMADLAAGTFGLDGETLMAMSPGLFSIMGYYYGYDVDYAITGETIYGDTAVVTVEYDVETDEGEGMTGEEMEIPLVKIDGTWYVSGLG